MGEEERKWQFAAWTVKVLYSPKKAFEEIARNPDVKGPILILILTLPLLLGYQYVVSTRFFLENPAPGDDLWTEKPVDPASFLWSSNAMIGFDEADHIAGNYSVTASINNSSTIWTHLTDIGNFNSSKGEYELLSFRTKWINEANMTPAATLQLFSKSDENNRFELSIGHLVANKSGVWTNITVNLETENWIEISEDSASWENITGIGFEFGWTSSADYTLKIDGLFFGKYELLSSLNPLSAQLVSSILGGAVDFTLKWLLLAGFLYLTVKSFAQWKGSWKNGLYGVGYVYSATLIYLLGNMLLPLFLPPLFIPYNVYRPFAGEEARANQLLLEIYDTGWGNELAYLLALPWNLVSLMWTALLVVIALKKMQALSWRKSLLLAVTAYILSLVFRILIPF